MVEKTPGKRSRITFSTEYNHEAARLVIDAGLTVAEVTRELDVGTPFVG